jgi:hypothetical protein
LRNHTKKVIKCIFFFSVLDFNNSDLQLLEIGKYSNVQPGAQYLQPSEENADFHPLSQQSTIEIRIIDVD